MCRYRRLPKKKSHSTIVFSVFQTSGKIRREKFHCGLYFDGDVRSMHARCTCDTAYARYTRPPTPTARVPTYPAIEAASSTPACACIKYPLLTPSINSAIPASSGVKNSIWTALMPDWLGYFAMRTPSLPSYGSPACPPKNSVLRYTGKTRFERSRHQYTHARMHARTHARHTHTHTHTHPHTYCTQSQHVVSVVVDGGS